MIKSIIIANSSGTVNFSHYFEPVPVQFRISFEKENVDRFLSFVFLGEKEIVIYTENDMIVSRREKGLLILLVVESSYNETIAIDFLHKLVDILFKHLKIVTDKQIVQNKEAIHRILNKMVIHGEIVNTRLNHIMALFGNVWTQAVE